ncbi:hypothetical protein [[Eubacterium] cellulosolvens]
MANIDGKKKIYIVIILYWLLWGSIGRIILVDYITSSDLRFALLVFEITFGLFGTIAIMFFGAIVLGIKNKKNPPDLNNNQAFTPAAKLNRRNRNYLPGAIMSTILDVIFLNFLMLCLIILILMLPDIFRVGWDIITYILYFVFFLFVFDVLSSWSQPKWDKMGELGWVYFNDNKLYLRKRQNPPYFIRPFMKEASSEFSTLPAKGLWNIPIDDVEKVVWSTNYDPEYMYAYIVKGDKLLNGTKPRFTEVIILDQDRIRDEDEFKRNFAGKLEERFIDKHTQPEVLDPEKHFWSWNS